MSNARLGMAMTIRIAAARARTAALQRAQVLDGGRATRREMLPRKGRRLLGLRGPRGMTRGRAGAERE